MEDLRCALRRFKPHPAYKASGVEWLGEIPVTWVTIPLKRIASIRYGLGEPPEQLANGLPFIRATNVSKGRIIAHEMQFVDPKDVPWDRDPVLRSDDIIVVRSGAYTGDSAIIPPEYDCAIAGYDMVVRPRRGSVPQFIAWALQRVRA
jgi:type I restriction enzyme S subunit